MISRTFQHSHFPRDLEGARYLDLFIVGGVSAVLAIRFLLRVTNYPSLGGARFHIAHMLWGGLLMAAALLISLSFLGNRSRLWAASVGGAGFGTFIDEIGKFITRDNNYFYKPSIALIYITFVLLYLTFRDLQARGRISREEYLVNAIRLLEEAVINDLPAQKRERALWYLDAIGDKDDLILGLATLIAQARVTVPPDGLLSRIRRNVLSGYEAALSRSNRFGGLITLFILQLAVNAGTVALIVLGRPSATTSGQRGATIGIFAISDWLLIASTIVPFFFVGIAIFTLRRSRTTALNFFHRAVLLSICLTEVFMFYQNQAAALAVLAFNLVSWACINIVIATESHRTSSMSRTGSI